MKHAVAVRTHERKVFEASRPLVCLRQGQDVVALDEPVAKVAVFGCEIEPADLTCEAPISLLGGCLLASHEVAVSFALSVKPEKDPSLEDALLAFFLGAWEIIGERASPDSLGSILQLFP